MNINHLTENELKEYANKIASYVVVYDSNAESGYVERESTKLEHEIIFNVVYGALQSFKYQNAVYNSIAYEAIINATEHTLICCIPQLSSYYTIWVPLMDFVGECTREIIDTD